MTNVRVRGLGGSALVYAFVLVAALGGCTRGGDSEGRRPSASRAPASPALIAEARAGGASAEQLAILAKGAVPSQEDYEAAVDRTIACLNAAGITTTPPDWSTQRGISFETFGVTSSSTSSSTATSTDEVVEKCIAENSRWVERAWEDQPWADVADQRRVEGLRPELIACLERGEADVDEDAPLIDLLQSAEVAASTFGAIDEGEYVDCAAEVGA